MERYNGKIWESEMTGKLTGIPSYGTTCKCNPYCQLRMMNGDLVCSRCYADATTSRYPSLEKHLEENFELLTTEILSNRDLPRVYTRFARIEAFGDVANTIQASNYLNLINENPDTFFGVWTKNVVIWDEIFKTENKPKNCKMVRSSERLNEPADVNEYWWNDTVFTVFTPDFVKANEIKINCGARDCFGCHQCYENNDIRYINEILKPGRKFTPIEE